MRTEPFRCLEARANPPWRDSLGRSPWHGQQGAGKPAHSTERCALGWEQTIQAWRQTPAHLVTGRIGCFSPESQYQHRRKGRSMSRIALIVMAAGMGSRYGGLKQLDPVGPGGEIILEYSVFDALRAGFETIAFVIRRDIEEAFRDAVGRKLETRADVRYVLQDLTDLPTGFAVPEGRTKPWGTGHAVLACRHAVTTPCAVINADDYYGASSFGIIADHLRTARDRDGVADFCMVGYELRNTLSEHGTVARGECDVAPDGYLRGARERTRIQQFADGIKYSEDGTTWVTLPSERIVSLNFWGFTPTVMTELDEGFRRFLRERSGSIATAEYFLPDVIGDLVTAGRARVKVLPTAEKWYGVTYRDDRPLVQAAIGELVGRGLYPARLWD